MSARTTYKFSKLTEGDSIRLIVLLPSGELETPIRCSLIHSTLSLYYHDIADSYVALSYVWGDVNDRAIIWVEEEELEVTASLEFALRHIRDPAREVKIWADGVCINQSDLEERNQQVAQMASVYSTAQHTIIFLGSATASSDLLFSRAMLGPRASTHLEVSRSRELAHGACDHEMLGLDVLSRPWFTRVWVLQELVMSRDPWVQCGTPRLRWDVFFKSIPWQLKIEHPIVKMNEIRHQSMALLAGTYAKSPYSSLFEVMVARRGFGLADPRDMLYAHLGICDIEPLAINIDYSLSCAEVYERFTVQILRFFGKQRMSVVFYEAEERVTDVMKRKLGLPSWVPNWSALGQKSRKLPLAPADTNTLWVCEQCDVQRPVPGILAVFGREYGTVIKTMFKREGHTPGRYAGLWSIGFNFGSQSLASKQADDIVDSLYRVLSRRMANEEYPLAIAITPHTMAGLLLRFQEFLAMVQADKDFCTSLGPRMSMWLLLAYGACLNTMSNGLIRLDERTQYHKEINRNTRNLQRSRGKEYSSTDTVAINMILGATKAYALGGMVAITTCGSIVEVPPSTWPGDILSEICLHQLMVLRPTRDLSDNLDSRIRNCYQSSHAACVRCRYNSCASRESNIQHVTFVALEPVEGTQSKNGLKDLRDVLNLEEFHQIPPSGNNIGNTTIFAIH